MAGFFTSTPTATNTQLPHDSSSKWSRRLKALFLLFSSRLLRGGPRLIINVAGCIFIIFLLLHFAPSSLSDRYYNILGWSTDDYDDVGDLRIVVFGSQDVIGSASDTSSTRTTWTEKLCAELNCTSLLSFVPTSEAAPGLTSNAIYGKELDALIDQARKADILNQPSSDYFFLEDQYPVSHQTPDLEAQVQQFLSQPPPAKAPRQTIWIFTFGTWDVWNLAAMPRKTSDRAIDALTAHIFSQVELLYLKALNPKSIAFSDFWLNASESKIRQLTAPNADDKVNPSRLETFRVLIPELFDISITPGWHKRIAPPIPHSKPEQMRDASWLTAQWNAQIRYQMEDWVNKKRSKPNGTEEEGIQETAPVTKPSSGSLLEYIPSSLWPHQTEQDGGQGDTAVIFAPYPRRAALQLNPTAAILDAMTEEELQRAGLKDSNGRGTLSAADPMRFTDVWTACKPIMNQVPATQSDQSSTCDEMDNHLFQDAFTVSQRAINGVMKTTAKDIVETWVNRKQGGWLG